MVTVNDWHYAPAAPSGPAVTPTLATVNVTAVPGKWAGKGPATTTVGVAPSEYDALMRDQLLNQLSSKPPMDLDGSSRTDGNASATSAGVADAIGAGLTSYSTWMDGLLERNDIKVASKFGVRYGLPGLITDLPGAVGGAIGLAQTYAGYSVGNYRGAAENGTGAIFSIGGAEAGAAAGVVLGAWFPPAELVTPVIGAVVGGIAGTHLGHWLGGSAYRWVHVLEGDGHKHDSQR